MITPKSLLLGALLLAACTPSPGDYETDYTETGGETGTETGTLIPTDSPIPDLPQQGEQWGPCYDDAPRCDSIGECTEATPGITMCSAPADVCPPALIGDIELPTTIMFDGTGKCVVLCAVDFDCHPEVGFVCGGEVCGWEG